MACLQTMTQDIQDRLDLLEQVGESSYLARHFFQQISIGNHFWVLPGHIEDQVLLIKYANYLAQTDGGDVQSLGNEQLLAFLGRNYEVRCFHGEERNNIGEYNKRKRICRFCGKSIPDTTFNQKAHAISECLGNKSLICREECDRCNTRFSRTIEPSIANYFHFYLILSGIKGKRGIATMTGEELTFGAGKRGFTEGRTTLVFNLKDMPNTRDPQEIIRHLSRTFSFPNESYVPQDVYKCFCKYVLSLIDSSVLPSFSRTIKWINEPTCPRRLPPVWRYSVTSSDSPAIIIMQRRHRQKRLPYCWAIINIASVQYIFITPFCSLDKYTFAGKTRYEDFISQIKEILPGISFTKVVLSRAKPVKINIKTDFTLAPDCVEGRDYFFVDPDNMTTRSL